MIRPFWLIFGLAVFLGGCVMDRSREHLPELSWPRAQNADALPAGSDPAYCYSTLGGVECYAAPLPASEQGRLVGYRGPAPRAAVGAGPLSP